MSDEGSAVYLIYLNFSKSFHLVKHRLLLAKLRGHGSTPTVINWVEYFLSRLTFQVNVSGARSQTAEARNGVPRGCVIGPKRLVIYVNEFPDNLSADSLLYADDVKLIAHRYRHEILHSPRQLQ